MTTSSLRAVEQRGGLMPIVLISSSLVLLALGILAGADPRALALLTLGTTAVALFHERMFRWHVLVGAVVGVVLFVPIKRYELPGQLPFDLELYRITIAAVLALWLSSLLVDADVSSRPTGFGGPLALFAVAIAGSILTNVGRIQSLDVSSDVAKKMLFFSSFYLLVFLVVSIIRDVDAIHMVLKTLVAGTTIVAMFGLVERRTGYNAFDHLQDVAPFLRFEGGEGDIGRAGRLRVYGSAQHPIALAMLFAMVLPLGVYLGHLTRRWWWWLATAMILLAVFATVSRTGVIALAAVAAIFVWLRRSEMKKLWPFVIPVLLAVHIATPGAIGGLRQAFFPSAGLVEDQTVYGGRLSAERLGPQIEIIKGQPLFGQGFGTRLPDGPRQNARVLDNEWLGTASEVGLVGVFALAWLFVRFIGRLGREAQRDLSARGWLLVALASGAAAFAVGMFTYDAFSFIQVTFVLFIMLGLGMAVLKSDERWSFPEAAATTRRRRALPRSSG